MSTQEKKAAFLGFKASASEEALIRQKMRLVGTTNKSAYIRAMALNGYILKLDLPELSEAVRLIGYLGSNVNQIAERLNERGSIYEMEMEEILEKQKEIQGILREILQKLNQIKKH